MIENYFGGVFAGTTMLQTNGVIGGARSVFVKLQGEKNDLVFPTFGGQLKNPFKGAAKIFAGDLFEYRTDEKGEKPEIYLLKTFEVAKASSDTTVLIVKDGFRHIPFVGDILMKAPDDVTEQGAAYTVTAVEETVDTGVEVWKLTFNTSLGSLTKGDILVEAQAENASTAEMVVKNVNAVAPCDFDCFYTPAAGGSSFNGARYYLTPALHGTMYVHKMSPVPDSILKFNKSRINGWFEL